MRSHARIAGVAFVALAAAAVSGIGSATAAPAGSDRQDDRVATAIKAATAHASQTKAGSGQSFKAVDTLLDQDGTSHVRLHRTYRGLEVVGGDLVVHQGKRGAWKGSSQTLKSTLSLGVEPTVLQDAARQVALRPSALNRAITGAKDQAAALVVDATGAKPTLAWRVITGGTQADGTPSRPRPTSTPAPARRSGPSSRSSTSTAPGRRSTPAAFRCS